MKKLVLAAVCFVFTLLSCNCDIIQRRGYDFSKVKTVRVERFSSCNMPYCYTIVYEEVAREEFIRQLPDRDYNVVHDKEVKVDAVIEGRITELTFFRTKDCCFEQALVGVSACMSDSNTEQKVWSSKCTSTSTFGNMNCAISEAVKEILKSLPNTKGQTEGRTEIFERQRKRILKIKEIENSQR